MDEDAGPYRSTRIKALAPIAAAMILLALLGTLSDGPVAEAAVNEGTEAVRFSNYLPLPLLVALVALLAFSGFFSGSETAFFSIHRLRLRAMAQEQSISGRLVTAMMQSPNRLLTTILVGNMLVNVLIAVLLGTRVQHYFEGAFGWSALLAYSVAVALVTTILVLFGEVFPKILAVRTSETFARITAVPLRTTDRLLAPLCKSLLRLTGLLFHMTRFHELRAAPFITDEEFKVALSAGETQGAIERDERQMIQGIIEFTDTRLREVLTPRPDVVALPSSATVNEALETYREHEYSRMPVFEEDIDHICGVIVMKDLLPALVKGESSQPVSAFLRKPLFVPETMTVPQFVRHAQQHRTHLGIVVDEYGGTAGIVTLEDAIEQVVGDIMDEGEQESLPYEHLGDNAFRVEGGLPLDELSDMLRIKLEDEEHETVAGFLMKMSDRILEPGDEVEHYGVRFVVERCEGRRVESVRIELTASAPPVNTNEEGGA